MAGFIDETLTDIDRRLGELKDEMSKLEAARVALAGENRSPVSARSRKAGRPAMRSRSSTPARRRASTTG